MTGFILISWAAASCISTIILSACFKRFSNWNDDEREQEYFDLNS